MFDLSQMGCTSVIHPPLSLTAAKELWIFWYGEEPDLTDLVSPELLKSPGKRFFPPAIAARSLTVLYFQTQVNKVPGRAASLTNADRCCLRRCIT